MTMQQDPPVYETAKKIISDYLRLRDDELQPDSHIVDDMGADSLALVELGFRLSETFGVPIMDAADEKLIFKNLVAYIEDHLNAKTENQG